MCTAIAWAIIWSTWLSCQIWWIVFTDIMTFRGKARSIVWGCAPSDLRKDVDDGMVNQSPLEDCQHSLPKGVIIIIPQIVNAKAIFMRWNTPLSKVWKLRAFKKRRRRGKTCCVWGRWRGIWGRRWHCGWSDCRCRLQLFSPNASFYSIMDNGMKYAYVSYSGQCCNWFRIVGHVHICWLGTSLWRPPNSGRSI